MEVLRDSQFQGRLGRILGETYCICEEGREIYIKERGSLWQQSARGMWKRWAEEALC